jgi:hypothetical protein
MILKKWILAVRIMFATVLVASTFHYLTPPLENYIIKEKPEKTSTTM